MSQAQDDSDYANVQVQLVTISPGEFYWSAYGHSAIRIKSPIFDRMFGFGYFDFADEDFFINFAQGKMQYFLGVVDSNHELSGYREEGRQVVFQNLELTTKQKQQLVEKMVFLAKPENRYYQYDYFLNNCTSKIRDILDEVTNGEISSQLKPLTTTNSWSDYTFPANNQAWMNLGIAYAYGLPAYDNKNRWDLSVFPEVFSADIKNLNAENKWNEDFEIYYQPSQSELQRHEKSFFNTHYAVMLVFGLLLIGLLIKKTHKTTKILWLIIQSLLGIGIVFLWFFTQHSVASWNINLLLFSPLALLLTLRITNKPLTLRLFITSNVLWLCLAVFLTNLYLAGFCLLNLIIWKNHKPA